jgi:hypothetical protein
LERLARERTALTEEMNRRIQSLSYTAQLGTPP